MNNIFQVGGEVSGDSLLGRKQFIEKLCNEYLFSTNRVGISLVGLPRIGKTSVAKAIIRNVPDNILPIYIDLKLCSNYADLWKKFCRIIDKYIKKYGIINNYLSSCLNSVITINSENFEWIELESNVTDIVDELLDLNIKPILIIDEFDNAEYKFENKTHYYELLRNLFSGHNLSSMLISRRQLYTIEHETYQSSTFHGVMEPYYLRGFDDADLNLYFKIFDDKDIHLTKSDKEQLMFYSGRSPYLLSIFGKNIINKNFDTFDIDSVYKSVSKNINLYYNDVLKYLNEDGDLEKLTKIIIGPRIDITNKDLDDLTNLGYIYVTNNSLVAISEYFTKEFLTSSIINIDINKKFLELEGLWRKMIRKEFSVIVENKKLYGNDILELQKEFLKQVKSKNGDLLPIGKIEGFRVSTKRKYNRDIDYIDATGPRECVAIFWDSWDLCFRKYFNNDEYSKWDDKLDKLSLARNPEFHPDPKDGPVLNALEKNEANLYIEQIFDVISNSEFNLKEQLSDAEILIIARKNKPDNENEELHFLVPDLSLIGEKVEFEATGFGGNTKETIRGVVDGKYKAVIPRDKSQVLSDYERKNIIGTKLPVVITEIRGEKCFLDFI